jgi:hypothetical protein
VHVNKPADPNSLKTGTSRRLESKRSSLLYIDIVSEFTRGKDLHISFQPLGEFLSSSATRTARTNEHDTVVRGKGESKIEPAVKRVAAGIDMPTSGRGDRLGAPGKGGRPTEYVRVFILSE